MSVTQITPRIAGFLTMLTMVALLLMVSGASGQTKVPKVFEPYLEPNKDYLGEGVDVVFPKEFEKYKALIKASEEKNPEWYAEYSKEHKPGVPLPYHKNLNLTPEQYREYRALWDKREFKVLEKVGVRLEQIGGSWRFLTTGQGARIPLLRYNAESDVFKSTNGELKRIEDIEAAAETILGAWTGVEWRFEEETPLGLTKENFAIGKSADGKFCLIVYRLQEITSSNTRLLDRRRVIRVPLK